MPETSPSLTPTKRLRANSKGEELYLVHLQRMAAPDPHPEDAEDDHDYEPTLPPRKSKKTVGEELFEVHLKRSQGIELDYDVDPEPKNPVSNESKGESESKSNYNLRTRKDNMAE